jgi:N-acetylglucosaminyldiphosphoundecaprenol N-acetyl-beta-D-mannosaminyltransferase
MAVDNRIDIMGCPVDALTLEETLQRITARMDGGERTRHMCVNAGKVNQMLENLGVRKAVRSADIISADGIGIVLAARALGRRLPERVTGIDVMGRLIGLAAERGWRPYFLGARPEVVEAVVLRFEHEYPSLDVAGYRDGYWSKDEEPDVVAGVRASGADLLFVALGTPQKELFQARWSNELGVPFMMGVGGAFDVFSGRVRRAPKWVMRLGAESLYRWTKAPNKAMTKRIAGNGLFLVRLAQARFSGFRVPAD